MPVKFQSTLPQGKWLLLHQYQVRHSIFQSTLPQGKWLGCFPFFIACSVFQSTLPQGKWRSPSCRFPFVYADFNPHFRKGSDKAVFTVPSHSSEFQSTLPQGKWRRQWRWWPGRWHFNPHFRKGSDGDEVMYGLGEKNFNPHFRKGSDLTPLVTALVPIVFQSTLPQGKWPHPDTHRQQSIHFNPHFRKGSDGDDPASHDGRRISIHTSAREVTRLTEEGFSMMSISIHTSAREVTYALLSQSQHLPISIHTSAREVTFALRDTFGYDIPISIHTSAREVTEGAFFQCFWGDISIHTSAREVTWLLRSTATDDRFQSTLPQGKWPVPSCTNNSFAHFNPHFRKGSDGSHG